MSIGRSGGRQILGTRYWSRNVVMDVILFYNLAAILKKKQFLFLLVTAKVISDVLLNRHRALNCRQHH
jgi:hypothetical protein